MTQLPISEQLNLTDLRLLESGALSRVADPNFTGLLKFFIPTPIVTSAILHEGASTLDPTRAIELAIANRFDCSPDPDGEYYTAFAIGEVNKSLRKVYDRKFHTPAQSLIAEVALLEVPKPIAVTYTMPVYATGQRRNAVTSTVVYEPVDVRRSRNSETTRRELGKTSPKPPKVVPNPYFVAKAQIKSGGTVLDDGTNKAAHQGRLGTI